MDFLFQSPEINSARMYMGPGAAPLMSAAAGWTAIATAMSEAAAGVGSTVMELAAVWMGPSYVSMASAAVALSGWYESVAVSAAQTGAQAQAAVVAYETAFAATVPPFVVAANRVRLATLVATNFLGVNTPAIAATEAEYMEMWARDVAAMVGYQASSASASQLTPFQPLSPLTTGVPAPAVSSSTGTAQSVLGAFLPQSFGDLMAGVQAFGSMATLAFEPVSAVMDEGLWGAPAWPSTTSALGAADAAADAAAGAAGVAADAASAMANAPTPTVNVGAPVMGRLGSASSVGGLSVPQSWTAATGKSSLVSAIASGDGEAGAPGFPGMPMTAMPAGKEQQKQNLKYLNRPRMLPTPVN